MKNKHPKLTFLLCCLLSATYTSFCWSLDPEKETKDSASTPKSAAETPPTAPQRVTKPKRKPRRSSQKKHPQLMLKDVRQRLIRYNSIRADINQTVTIGERTFRAEGSYVQSTNLRLRLEFAVIINQKQRGSLLQVCEGDVLWTEITIGDERRVTRRVVHDILKAAAENGELSKNMLIAQLGLGGLPALVASIEQNMIFDAMKEETIDGTDFVILQGHWNEKFIKRWQETDPEEQEETKTEPKSGKPQAVVLPMRVPDIVRIYCNKTTLFPQRILYLKKHPEKKRYRQMVVLDFKNVQINGLTRKEEFQYVPPDGIIQEDDTKRYLDLLNKSKRQRKRVEQGLAPVPTKLK